jgi:hypothetical protein
MADANALHPPQWTLHEAEQSKMDGDNKRKEKSIQRENKN